MNLKHRSTVTEAESREGFQQVSKDLLEHRADQGVNYWAGSPYPTILIWAGRIFEFLQALEKVTGFLPARRQSYEVGYRSGWDGAEVSSAQFAALPPAEAAIQLMLSGNRVLSGAGWGRAAIEYDPDAKSVVWEFHKGTAIGLAAKMQGMREQAACPFMAGFIAGWTDRALGLGREVIEVECVACGFPRCRFETREFLRVKELRPSKDSSRTARRPRGQSSARRRDRGDRTS